jgi:arylsulfatase A-like enzyme
MSLLSNKLSLAGFESHFIGKTNLGFQTADHMPVERGFTSHVGFLYGMEDYHYGNICYGKKGGCIEPTEATFTTSAQNARCTLGWGKCIPNTDMTAHATAEDFTKDFWHDRAPGADLAKQVYYSTNFYTDRAVSILRNYSATTPPQVRESKRLWIHLCYQAVHGPFEDVPEWERSTAPFWNGIYGDMLSVMDTGLRNITAELKSASLWGDTLIVIFSDNGGPSSPVASNNYPLRGSKETPWEGGTRVAAMVSVNLNCPFAIIKCYCC